MGPSQPSAQSQAPFETRELHHKRKTSPFLLDEVERLDTFDQRFFVLWVVGMMVLLIFWFFYSGVSNFLSQSPQLIARAALLPVLGIALAVLDRRIAKLLPKHYKYIIDRNKLLLFLHLPLPEGHDLHPGNLLAAPIYGWVTGFPHSGSFRRPIRTFITQLDQIIDFFTPKSGSGGNRIAHYFKLHQAHNPTIYWMVLASVVIILLIPLLLVNGSVHLQVSGVAERWAIWHNWTGPFGFSSLTLVSATFAAWLALVGVTVWLSHRDLLTEWTDLVLFILFAVSLLLIIDAALYPLVSTLFGDFRGFFQSSVVNSGLLEFSMDFNWGRAFVWTLLAWLPLTWLRYVVTVAVSKERAVLLSLSRN